jgi:FixJ family two-component response regulator
METVCIVDDDLNLARALARLVDASGWKARTFASAAEFLAAADVAEADLGCVVLDVSMPQMRGPELHRAMVEKGMSVPVIFLTAHGDVRMGVDAMKLGACDFLQKPVTAPVLVEAIRAALARHAANRQQDRARREVVERMALLSPREREVMRHVIAGRLNKQIAADLGISVKTVKAHRAKVMEKTDAASVPALIDMCRIAGVGAASAPARKHAERSRP